MYPGVKMISGIEVTLSEMRNIIICVATGTALTLKTVENRTTTSRRHRTTQRVNK
jgi:hypothetical protein